MKTIFDEIAEYSGSHKWDTIIIHHSATVDGKFNDWNGIKKYHTSWRYKDEIISEEEAQRLKLLGTEGIVAPWQDIGYHAGIEFDNGNFTYRIGRSLDIDGAHTAGLNSRAIGICIVGDFDKSPPCHVQNHLAACLCRAYMQKFGIAAVNVLPHRWFASYKTCPGNYYNMGVLRRYIQEGS